MKSSLLCLLFVFRGQPPLPPTPYPLPPRDDTEVAVISMSVLHVIRLPSMLLYTGPSVSVRLIVCSAAYANG